MQRSLSWVDNMFSASQEISLILWNAEGHNRNDKSPPTVPSLSQISPFHPPIQLLENKF